MLVLLPFEQLVTGFVSSVLRNVKSLDHSREPQVRLNDDVQPPCTNKAVCTWETQAQLVHDLGDADGGRPADPHSAVDESGGTINLALFNET